MKVAVFLPNWVGDVVMATPALCALRRHFADARMIGVLRPYVADVLAGSPWLNDIVYLDKKGPLARRWPGACGRLRREKPDLAVLFTNSFHTAWVAWLGKCRRRVGYRRYGRGWLLSDLLEPIRDNAGRLTPSPVIDAYNRLAEHAGCAAPGHRMQLFTTPQDEKAADIVWDRARFDRNPEVICLNPGAMFGSAKFWYADYFADLARHLVDRRGSGVLILCGPGERAMAADIARLAGRPGIHALGDLSTDDAPLSLGLTKACVRRADLLVTTDSGPRHFAAAFQRPVVTLFGPTHVAWTETYFAGAVHLQKKVDCGPCQLRVCPRDHRCMKELVPAEVYSAVEKLLARFPPASPMERARETRQPERKAC
jgi:lipopolysaccharide heptosyltransferase II